MISLITSSKTDPRCSVYTVKLIEISYIETLFSIRFIQYSVFIQSSVFIQYSVLFSIPFYTVFRFIQYSVLFSIPFRQVLLL